MMIGVLPAGDPGVFRSLLLPEAADALAAGEPVTALALTQDDIAIGAAAGYLENDRFQILSLYVAPDYRRCGGGRMLLEELFWTLDGYASGMDIRFTQTAAEHKTLIPFLENMGFAKTAATEETIYRTSLGKALETPFFAAATKGPEKTFAELSEGALSLAEKSARMAEAPLPESGLSGEHIEKNLSLAVMSGGKVQGYVVFESASDGELILSAAWSDGKNPALMPSLLRSAVARMREAYPAHTQIAIQAVNPASAALIRALLPEAETVSYTYSCSFDGEI